MVPVAARAWYLGYEDAWCVGVCERESGCMVVLRCICVRQGDGGAKRVIVILMSWTKPSQQELKNNFKMTISSSEVRCHEQTKQMVEFRGRF